MICSKRSLLKALLLAVLTIISLQAQAVAQTAETNPVETRPAEARDDSSGRIGIDEENDYFASNDDRHYTQGLRFTYVSGAVTSQGAWDQPFNWLNDVLPIFSGADRKRKYEWDVAGQSIFTPTNLERTNPSRKDRPYAAWLYTGGSLLQETNYESHSTLENFEVLGGVVGPAALGEVTQNDFHEFINENKSLGWQNQIHNEIGGILTYERKWRFQQPLIGNLAVDAIPELGASGGNVLTYGETSGMVRFGQNLGADYGPDRVRPSLSGTGWFNPDKMDSDFGWYVFAGSQGRAVAQNIFLDGDTFVSSPSVSKKPLVADFTAGASLFWSSAMKVDLSATQRTKEFYGQQGHPDRFGIINFVVGL